MTFGQRRFCCRALVQFWEVERRLLPLLRPEPLKDFLVLSLVLVRLAGLEQERLLASLV